MGLFDFFSKEGREKGAVERNVKRASNKFLQSEDRMAALVRLSELGTDEALYGLAKRFAFAYDKGIDDEREKEFVVDALVAKGEKSIPAVKRFILEADTISYGLHVLEKIARPAQLAEVLDELIAREEPGYTRDPTRKIQMLTWMDEWKDVAPEDAVKRIAPYLADFDETVRFTAVNAVGHHPHESAKAALLDALLRKEEESRRIKVRIAEVLAEHGWTVTERKEEVAALLATQLPEYGMQHDKLQKKKDK